MQGYCDVIENQNNQPKTESINIVNMSNCLSDITKSILQNSSRIKDIEKTIEKMNKSINEIGISTKEVLHISNEQRNLSDITISGITQIEFKINELMIKYSEICNNILKSGDDLTQIQQTGNNMNEIILENRRLLKELKDIRITVKPSVNNMSSRNNSPAMSPRTNNITSPRQNNSSILRQKLLSNKK